MDRVPVIDIAALCDPASLAAIDRACRDWGFFQVTGHGIDPASIDRLLAVAREFFAQPAAAKRAIARDADNPWGYFDRELTGNRRDWKEIFDFGPADGGRLAPRWPDGALRRRFEPAVRDHYGYCRRLALRLLEVVAGHLGARPDQLLRAFGPGHTSFLRLNRYPPRPGAAAGGASVQEDAAFGVGAHTDAGALTLLLQDAEPGLEVYRDGHWYLVEPVRGALVVNVGDIVQVWSNDRYRAALHRVVTDPATDRYSVPFFLNPTWETCYAPLAGAVSPRRPARYRAISWREFRRLRAAGDYADLGEEIQIGHYRI